MFFPICYEENLHLLLEGVLREGKKVTDVVNSLRGFLWSGQEQVRQTACKWYIHVRGTGEGHQ